jgi:hypothetical protein
MCHISYTFLNGLITLGILNQIILWYFTISYMTKMKTKILIEDMITNGSRHLGISKSPTIHDTIFNVKNLNLMEVSSFKIFNNV